MSMIDNEQEMNVEHEAWTDVMTEFRALFPGVDANDTKCNPLWRAVELWGEQLVALRVKQDENTRQQALDRHQAQYEAVRTG